MNTLKIFFAFIAFCFFAVACGAQTTIKPKDAKNHVGKTVTVCGVVASPKYLPRNGITLLNLDEPYPNQVFTAVIYREDRSKFGEPENKCANKNICVTGEVTMFRGTPQIVMRNPSQLKGC